jgi:hypothetical protein
MFQVFHNAGLIGRSVLAQVDPPVGCAEAEVCVRRSELGIRARVSPEPKGGAGAGPSGTAAARPGAVLAEADFGDGRARAINAMMIADPACERRFRGRDADREAWCAKPKAP